MATISGKKKYFFHLHHTLSKKEKETLCAILFTLKVHDGYSSNTRSHISMDELVFNNMKSHYFHILMQQLLRVALYHVLPKEM